MLRVSAIELSSRALSTLMLDSGNSQYIDLWMTSVNSDGRLDHLLIDAYHGCTYKILSHAQNRNILEKAFKMCKCVLSYINLPRVLRSSTIGLNIIAVVTRLRRVMEGKGVKH